MIALALALGVLSHENPTLLVPEVSFERVHYTVDEDEIHIVEKLIATTEEQLKKQKWLREQMSQFQKRREEFVQGNHSKAHASQLVHSARKIYATIQEGHFEHLFSKDYLDELQFFSSIAGKTSVGRP
jgi:hypothetical protein